MTTTITCPRCFGTGKMPFAIANGVCFCCEGRGTVNAEQVGIQPGTAPTAAAYESDKVEILAFGEGFVVTSKVTGMQVKVFGSEAFASDGIPASKRKAAEQWAIKAVARIA